MSFVCEVLEKSIIPGTNEATPSQNAQKQATHGIKQTQKRTKPKNKAAGTEQTKERPEKPNIDRHLLNLALQLLLLSLFVLDLLAQLCKETALARDRQVCT